MKAKELIEILQDYKEDEEIVAFWWSVEDFVEEGNPISPELWAKAVEYHDENSYGSSYHDMMDYIYDALWEYKWCRNDMAEMMMIDEMERMLNSEEETK
jgi:NH3-dependent NAD+ synthetase